MPEPESLPPGQSVNARLPTAPQVQATMLERLSAVHALLSVERQATEYDIVITTVLEALRPGPMTDLDLLVEVRRVWPGAGLSAARLDAAVSVASRAGYVARVSEQAERTWTLSAVGRSEVESSRDWARDIVKMTAEQLREQVAQAGYPLSESAGELWTHHLELALHAAIRQSFAPYQGEVSQRGDWWLSPRSFDREALIKTARSSVADPQQATLLEGLAYDAIDPTSPFANELVTHITIGYLLHAFLGRRDHLDVRVAVGSLTGDRAILDTPVLLHLLGPDEKRRPIQRAIEAAIEAKMEVIALDHYVQELSDLIEMTERNHGADIDEALKIGVRPGLVGRMVSDDVISLWLQAVDDGFYATWTDFAAAAARLTDTLRAMGVLVRAHRNQAADKVPEFIQALSSEVPARAWIPTQRDANTMAMARRARERVAGQRLFWPGAWVITTDRHMGPAYKKLCPADQVSLTLTPARWLGLISSCSTPATMEQLASSAATLLAEETFLTIAARYPVKTAIRIAQALGPASGGSPLDLRLAHLSLDELIANQPNFADKADDVGAKVTAAVMTLRSSRLNTSFEAGSARLRTHREAAVSEAEEIRRQLKVETEAKAQLEAERARERAQAKRDLEEFQVQKERELQAERRRWQARLGYVPFAILLALAVLQVNLVWAAAAVLGLLVFWHQATEWTHDPKRGWRSFLPAAVIEVVGLAAAVWPLLQSK